LFVEIGFLLQLRFEGIEEEGSGGLVGRGGGVRFRN
jgi:hypothetical protein